MERKTKMPQFPTRKNDLRALSQAIVAGIQTNPADFPTPPFDWGTLAGINGADVVNRTNRQNSEAATKGFVDVENANLDDMGVGARRQIDLATAMYPGNDAMLAKFGWSDNAAPKTDVEISQPRNLVAVVQGPGDATLDWNSPQTGARSLRNYIVERQVRDITTNTVTEEWGAWQRSVTQSEISLPDMPRGVNISFRVSAVNSTMTSTPSNTVDVVL